MSDTITVNGVVFTRAVARGDAVIYENHDLRIEKFCGEFCAYYGDYRSRWCPTAEKAFGELQRRADEWVRVSRELARVTGKTWGE